MRRIATVTTSAPLSSWACCMISSDGYFPIPSVSILVSVCMLTPCDRDDDLEPVAVAQRGQAVLRARNDIVVQRDGAAVAADAEAFEQRIERRAVGGLLRLAVDRDRHEAPFAKAASGSVPPREGAKGASLSAEPPASRSAIARAVAGVSRMPLR